MVTLLRLDCTYILPRRKKKVKVFRFLRAKNHPPASLRAGIERDHHEGSLIMCPEERPPVRLALLAKDATDARRVKGA